MYFRRRSKKIEEVEACRELPKDSPMDETFNEKDEKDIKKDDTVIDRIIPGSDDSATIDDRIDAKNDETVTKVDDMDDKAENLPEKSRDSTNTQTRCTWSNCTYVKFTFL